MLVKNHCRGIIRLLKGKLELKPGENTVPDEDWNAVNKNAHVIQLIAMKRLSVSAGGEVEKPLPTKPPAEQMANDEKTPDSLSQAMTTDITAKEAIKLVKESSDEAWLQACLDKEERSTVTDAIYARMDELDILPED
jgi:hypothetical protein